ncbi:Inactive dipeptidyl peptidase 10 [Folsomia candida]|uniref:Venom dipeptidyl peptidase 4 n=1 Tax=Folsomia candida TaxID=158441 RepID=A0A226F1G1_FOLCA|nr:Inactive dipeptidyl peptidase 10 [Folsomia candida]
MDDNFYEDDDLVVSSQPDRNWKGIIIAVLVIASVCSLIVTSVYLLTPPEEGPRVKGRRLELQDIFSHEFQPYHLNGSWIGDEWIYRDASGGISLMDIKNANLSIRVLVSNFTFRRFNAVSFSLSRDPLRFVLFTHDILKTHRFSFIAKYTLFEIATGETQEVSIEHSPSSEEYTFQLVKWAPTGNGLVLVHNGDIYYKANPKDKKSNRITYSGQPGVIFNGIPDWLYEEEIFGSNSALWFSSDGQSLLYLTFNDSLVGEHHILEYGTVDEPYLYPRIKSLRYPKPGTNNPTVKASIVDLRFPTRTREIIPPDGMSELEHYITAAGWIRSTDVIIVWTSRAYNLSLISICSTKSGRCEEVYRITAEKRGWVETVQLPIFTKNVNSKNFIAIAPIRDGENGFFDHLIFVDTLNQRSHPVTFGNFDVVKINAWDEENKLVYYTATPSTHPGQRRLFRVKMEQPYTEHVPSCLLCQELNDSISTPARNGRTTKSPKVIKGKDELAPPPKKTGQKQQQDGRISPKPTPPPKGKVGGSDTSTVVTNNRSCSFVTNMKFNVDKTFLVLECSGPQIPFVALYSTFGDENSTTLSTEKIIGPHLRLISILQSNEALIQRSNTVAYPQSRVFSVHLMAGHTVQVKLLLPPGLREEEITKYPLVLNVYGGPGTQLAIERWNIDFATYLASKKNYIVAQVDSRGSGGRGWDFQHQVYYRLGELEVTDQIEVIRHLRDSLHFVDQKRVGIWGWSYGAYLTAMIMTSKESNDLFQCGASIAPVSNWKLYDSAYTERYMGKPNVSDNYKGYADSDVTKNVEPLASKMFFLAHGTADDNVHIQHSMLLAKALIEKKILFRQQVYADEGHSLNGAKYHVHKSMESFFEDCFKKQNLPNAGIGLNKGGKFDEYDE